MMEKPDGPQAGTTPQVLTHLRLLAASQPDIVRSVQKDDLYQQQLVDQCYELVRSTCGAFAALQYTREIRLVANLLYHGLTTGTGLPTLGEEYCNMAQVTGTGRSPAMSRRLALVLLRGLGPYVADSMTARMDRQQAAQAETAYSTATPSSSFTPTQQGTGDQQAPLQGAVGPSTAVGTRSGAGESASSTVLATQRSVKSLLARQQLMHWLRTWWRVVVRYWERAWEAAWPHARGVAVNAARLHLALFYMHGVFYSIPNRLADVRYASVSRPLQGRPSYRVLGMLLVAQLGIAAGMHMYQSVNTWAEQRAARAVGAPDAAAAGGVRPSGPTQHAVMLCDGCDQDQDESEPMSEEGALLGWTQIDTRLASGETGGAASSSGQPRPAGAVTRVQPLVVMSGRTCPLCLSPRTHPTSTPCGHVFCWDCVAQWCNEKPECPLCRARVLLPTLVPVYHCAHF